jgi:HK97 family phage portal protein
VSGFGGLIVKAITRLVAGGLSPVNPALYRYLQAGAPNHAGKPMSTETSLTLPTVFACSDLLSGTIATLPFAVFHDLGNGRAELAREHWLYPILHDQPNADMTATEFWQTMMVSLILKGNAFAEIERAGGLSWRVIALTPIPVEAVTIRRAGNGERLYTVNMPGQRTRELGEQDVMHLKGMSLDGIWGLSRISLARHTLGIAYAAEESAGKMFANGMQSSGFFSVDTILKREHREQLKNHLGDFVGSEQAGKHMLLEGGLKYSPMTLLPVDAELLRSRQWSVEDVCRWFRVPPFMIGHTEKVTSWGTGLEQQVIGFLTFTLRPYLKLTEQAVKRSLIPASERDKLYAEFNIEGLLRADSAGRAAFYASMAQNGIMTRNEIRGKENLSPMPGGDELTFQSNLIPARMAGQNAAPPQQAASGDPDAPRLRVVKA